MTISFSSANTRNISNVNGTDLNSNGVSVTAGQLVVYVGRWEAGGSSDAATVSVSDNLSSTWDTVRYERTASSEDSNIAVSWALAASTGTMTVTGTLSAGREYRRAQLTIYDTSGVTLADNDIATSPTNSSTWTGGSVDYTDGDLTVCCLGNYNSSSDPGVASSGMTEATSGEFVHTFYRVMSGSGTFSPVGDWASDDSYAVVSLLFTEEGGTTVNITGQAVTSAQGALTITGAAAVAITGQSSTLGQGTLTVTTGGAVSVSLTGQSAAFSQGTISATGAASVAITGQASTLGQGTISVTAGGAVSVTLSGQASTVSQGSLVATGAALVSITGQEITSAQGTITVSISAAPTIVSLSGQAITSNIGTISLQTANIISLVGQSMTFSQGSVTVTGDVPTVPDADGITVSGSFGNGVSFTASFGNGIAVKGKL